MPIVYQYFLNKNLALRNRYSLGVDFLIQVLYLYDW